MNPLYQFIVLHPGSGTYFSADEAVLIDTRRLSAEELELINEGSDSDRAQVAFEQGHDLENLIDPSTLTYDDVSS